MLQHAQNFIHFLKDMNVFRLLISQLVFKDLKYFILKQQPQPLAFSSNVDQSDRSDLNEVGRSRIEKLNNLVTSLKMPFEEKRSLKDLMS